MEFETLVSLMWMSERMVLVGVSGLAVYWGYWLFELSPLIGTAALGEVELPGIGIVVAKGPSEFLFAGLGISRLLNRWAESDELNPEDGVGDAIDARKEIFNTRVRNQALRALLGKVKWRI